MDVADTTTLDKFKTVGDGRWGATFKKPFITFTGNMATTPQLAIAVPDARKSDKINAQLVEPGGVDLPFVVAARGVARIAKLANNPMRISGTSPSRISRLMEAVQLSTR
jgi:hypothetical protein